MIPYYFAPESEKEIRGSDSRPTRTGRLYQKLPAGECNDISPYNQEDMSQDREHE